MRTLLWILLYLDYAFLLMIGSIKIDQYNVSEFVFKEQISSMSGQNAKKWRRLYIQLPQVSLLQQVELVVAGTIFVSLLLSLNSVLVAVGSALLAFTSVRVIARIDYVQLQSTKLFERSLDVILTATNVLQPLWWLLGVPDRTVSTIPGSQSELLDQLSKLSPTVLSSIQKQRLKTVIESQTKVVKDVMTPKRSVVSVKPQATLGPVLLSDLQKTSHGYFPVFEKKSEPEGVLDISELSDIQTAKQRQTVRDSMNTQLVWVEEDTSLEELVQAFLQEKQYLLFVRNLNGDFTGIVTIADLLKQLIGIVKE